MDALCHAVIRMQAIWRGSLGRKKAKKIREKEKEKELIEKRKEAAAIVIQVSLLDLD